ncbi:hypothetical protein GCM10010965_19890 [Caldalkalibacillus thermarum]|nr:hypothetical protein GCM10010965_19890 [Caldalkalibacillus thermarum]
MWLSKQRSQKPKNPLPLGMGSGQALLLSHELGIDVEKYTFVMHFATRSDNKGIQ